MPVDTPVIEYAHPAHRGRRSSSSIARYIGGIIDDGSTLQIGLGRVTNEALKYLADRQDLGIHSDVITDAIIPLLEKGILTGRRKTQPARQDRHQLRDGHAAPVRPDRPQPAVLVPAHRRGVRPGHASPRSTSMVSVTQAFAIDLTGQVCADQLDGEFYSGVAAQGEFLRGASRSPGGKAIICLASTDDDGATLAHPRRRWTPGEGVTVARTDVHYVITEYGIAYLFGKSIRERAMALIEVAHPKFRAELFAQAQALGYLPRRADAEEPARLPGGGRADGDAEGQAHACCCARRRRPTTREHPPPLPPACPTADVYTRFFRKVRGLSDQRRAAPVQRELRERGRLRRRDRHAREPADRRPAPATSSTRPPTWPRRPSWCTRDWQGCGLGARAAAAA